MLQLTLTSWKIREMKKKMPSLYCCSAAHFDLQSEEKRNFTINSKLFHQINLVYGLVQGDPNRNFLFQIAPLLNWYIFDPMLVKPKCVWQVAVFFSVSWFFQAFEIYVWKIARIKHQRLWSWGKALDCHAKGPGFDPPSGQKNIYFWRNFYFFLHFWKIYF